MTILLLLALTTICYFIMGNYLKFGDWWYRSTCGFNLGMIVKYYETQIKTQLMRFIVPIMFIVPFFLFCIYASGHFGVGMEMQAIGFSILLLLFIYVTGFKSCNYFNWLGKYSYEIYLCHPMGIAFYALWPMHGIFGDLIYTFFLLSLTMLMAYLLKTITIKILKVMP